MTGGKSEIKAAVNGASCAISTLRLVQQECEEGNIPREYCPDAWRPERKPSRVHNQRREDTYISRTPIEKRPKHSQFQQKETARRCPKCGTLLEFKTSRCDNCLIALEWEYDRPQIVEKEKQINEENPFVAVQSRSSF